MLLGLHDEAEQARSLIVDKLSFDRDGWVKNFEITIRVLGGLLSAHQMTGDPRLLALADIWGDACSRPSILPPACRIGS